MSKWFFVCLLLAFVAADGTAAAPFPVASTASSRVMTGVEAKAVAATIDDAVALTRKDLGRLVVVARREDAGIVVEWSVNEMDYKDGGVRYLLHPSTFAILRREMGPPRDSGMVLRVFAGQSSGRWGDGGKEGLPTRPDAGTQ